ncbi:MAG: tRNA (N6-isopentenyl adenosine(37)-C2)-methylthiotransferase MiaB [Peptococcaceae bacterium]|jgi:tRNA-2-methylthio-N6-dimethylallyladenosine synthase|nr:tRNA (N6-isopentenyl adenosine(37)-C2)-methylthiotransferase MiaB [Peptococcaceae bacterium]MDH7524133.1 tRNA (N6-isopentenyl adenosine(37)-C2)-methylthiotransferase MiaB [Peptococcaceae bacterium]
MRFFLTTFGCQANERDSEIIRGLLMEKGYEPAEKLDEADLILFNTCCVREKAEDKVFSQVGKLKELKSKRPDLVIGICGCMVQQESMAETIRRRAPHVDLIFGTHNVHELPLLLEKLGRQKAAQVSVYPEMKNVIEGLPDNRQYSFKALVHITYGCDNFCTYCIVPYVRGREKSRQPKHIISEIKRAVSDGAVEVMLLGQNVNSYGKDLRPPMTFARLLEEIDGIEGLRRIRYMTSHPRDFSDRLLETIARSKKVCRHFHLPVQAGSNRILRLMNRGYTREEYLILLEKVRRLFPEAAVTTDIIVSFPGETEEDFACTLDLVERARFDSAFTFMFSPRRGTPAAVMEGQLSQAVKKDRLQRLMKLQNKISLEINQSLKGKVLEVLVEGRSKTASNILTGRTDGNKTVLFSGPEELAGQIVKVKITSPQTWVLKGRLV